MWRGCVLCLTKDKISIVVAHEEFSDDWCLRLSIVQL